VKKKQRKGMMVSGAKMQKADVSQGKTKMDKLVKRRELPYVHHSRAL
jgi:hypothetical protein